VAYKVTLFSAPAISGQALRPLNLNLKRTFTFKNTATTTQIEDAKEIIAWYTLAASVTGAIPVPAASAAIVGESGCMIAHVASVLGTPITVGAVLGTVKLMGTLNIAGRFLFVEGAKLLSWGTGNVWALLGLSALGATTAGVQTYIIGRLAIEIGKNGGEVLPAGKAAQIIADCRELYDAFVKEWSGRKIRNPGQVSAAY
jgi:uncharacterized protein (DUF697 family)